MNKKTIKTIFGEPIDNIGNYKSPIELIRKDMELKVEGDIIKAVQGYNINVDRKELIKALKYDREQYEKGFKDGVKRIIQDLYDVNTYDINSMIDTIKSIKEFRFKYRRPTLAESVNIQRTLGILESIKRGLEIWD